MEKHICKGASTLKRELRVIFILERRKTQTVYSHSNNVAKVIEHVQ